MLKIMKSLSEVNNLKTLRKIVAATLSFAITITGISVNANNSAIAKAQSARLKKAKAVNLLKVSFATEKKIPVTDNFRFTVDESGALTAFNAEGYDFTKPDEWGNQVGVDVVVPDKINGIKVTSIKGAFKDMDKLEGIVLPYDIKVLDNEAFSGCKSLKRINIYNPAQDTVKDETGADTITVQEYRQNTVSIPDLATEVKSDAFKWTSSVREFNVPASNAALATLNEGTLLTTKDNKSLIRYASSNHSAELYSIPDSIENIGDYACESAVDTKGFNIPSSVKNIGNYGFYNSNLQFIKFTPDSNCETIGSHAFEKNQNLETSLPKSVKEIGAYCFAECENLRTAATVSGAALSTTENTGLIDNSSITVIPDYCFYNSRNLHSLNIPASVTQIGAYAFSEVVNISTVTFEGDTLSSLGEGAFMGADNLNTIKIPEGLTSIQDNTFSGCVNLGVVKLPESLEIIGDEAFKDCHNINTLVIPENVKYISNTSFSGANTSNVDVSQSPYASLVVKGIKVATPAAVGKTFNYGALKYKVTSVVVSKGAVKKAEVQIIGFKNTKTRNKITSITIPAKAKYKGFKYNVVSIKKGALKNAKKVKRVTIGTNITTIGATAFYGLKKVKVITFKTKRLKKVGARVFARSNKKAIIKVPKKYYKKYKKLLRGKGIKRIRK